MRPLLLVVVAPLLFQARSFEPARMTSGSIGEIPLETAVAGAAALELTLDERGTVSNVDVLKDLEPFTSLLKESTGSWRFEPARENGSAVETRVLVGGLFRPRMLLFPNPGPPSGLRQEPSDEVPFPTGIEVPPYPPMAVGSGIVIVEIEVDETGAIGAARARSGEGSPFADAAVASARQWTFRSALRKNRPVRGYAYVVFSFPQPVT
jgi:hypothetical protein